MRWCRIRHSRWAQSRVSAGLRPLCGGRTTHPRLVSTSAPARLSSTASTFSSSGSGTSFAPCFSYGPWSPIPARMILPVSGCTPPDRPVRARLRVPANASPSVRRPAFIQGRQAAEGRAEPREADRGCPKAAPRERVVAVHRRDPAGAECGQGRSDWRREDGQGREQRCGVCDSGLHGPRCSDGTGVIWRR